MDRLSGAESVFATRDFCTAVFCGDSSISFVPSPVKEPAFLFRWPSFDGPGTPTPGVRAAFDINFDVNQVLVTKGLL